MEKVVKIKNLKKEGISSIKEDLDFWLSKTPEERIEAVEILRRQIDGNTGRLQRTAHIIQRK
jgi:hypothetical protein